MKTQLEQSRLILDELAAEEHIEEEEEEKRMANAYEHGFDSNLPDPEDAFEHFDH
jgi:hypothetical protein